LENAVKHNEISEKYPLQVNIDLRNKKLIVSNRMRKKRNLEHSSGIGLKNLDERFKITTGHGIISGITDGNIFQVTMPLIPLGT
jgi:sensor histidine kinase YesM